MGFLREALKAGLAKESIDIGFGEALRYGGAGGGRADLLGVMEWFGLLAEAGLVAGLTHLGSATSEFRTT